MLLILILVIFLVCTVGGAAISEKTGISSRAAFWIAFIIIGIISMIVES